MSDLIETLSRLGAREAVIDKSYKNDSCADKKANERFRDAVNKSQLRIVVGLETGTTSSRTRGWALTLSPSFDFQRVKVAEGLNDLETNHPVVEALMRFNTNLLKIPLEWPVLNSDAKLESGSEAPDHSVNTLSFAAARMADPEIVNRRGLAQYLSSRFHPYGVTTNIFGSTPQR